MMASSHLNFMVGAGEELPPKRKEVAVWDLFLDFLNCIYYHCIRRLFQDWGHTGTMQSLLGYHLHQVPSGGLSSGGSILSPCKTVLFTLPSPDWFFFQITSASSQTLKGHVLCRTTLKDSSTYC